MYCIIQSIAIIHNFVIEIYNCWERQYSWHWHWITHSYSSFWNVQKYEVTLIINVIRKIVYNKSMSLLKHIGTIEWYYNYLGYLLKFLLIQIIFVA